MKGEADFIFKKTSVKYPTLNDQSLSLVLSSTNAIPQKKELGLPRWLSGERMCLLIQEIPDTGSIPGSGRSPGEGNGNPLQYACLENSMDREEPGGLQSMRTVRVRQD